MLTERSRAAHAEIEAILAKGSKMKGTDRDRIHALLGPLMRDFSPSNVAFGVQIMREATTKVVTEAQTEADAAIATMLQDLGERALAAGAKPALPEGIAERMNALEAPEDA